jgi:hypothetical protein
MGADLHRRTTRLSRRPALPSDPQFEAALRRCAKQILTPLANRHNAFTEYDPAAGEQYGNAGAPMPQTRQERIAERDGADVQVVLRSGARALQFRDLHVSCSTSAHLQREQS